MNGVIVFCALCILLAVGKVVRMNVPLLQRLYLPSSLASWWLCRRVENFINKQIGD